MSSDSKRESRRKIAEQIVQEWKKKHFISALNMREAALSHAIETALKSETERCAELAEACHPQPCICQTCLIRAEAGAAIRRTIRNEDTKCPK